MKKVNISEIINRYTKLCGYCEGFWKRTKEKYPGQIACAPRCSNCCGLKSVNYLEAYFITERQDLRTRYGRRVPADGTVCPYLGNDLCRIYQARPLICRTHGLLLKSREFRGRLAPSCPRNFTRDCTSAFSGADALDMDRITENLARLNAAFCLLLGDLKKAGERISLYRLASGEIDRSSFSSNDC